MPSIGKKRLADPSSHSAARHPKRCRKALAQVSGNSVTFTPPAPQQQGGSPSSSVPVSCSSSDNLDELWHVILAGKSATDATLLFRDGTASANNSGHADRTRACKKASASTASGRAVSDSAADGTEDRTTISSTFRAIGPQQTRFREVVLDPRGIKLRDQKPKAKPPETHFGTEAPPHGDYTADALHSHTSIWVSVDSSKAEAISRHYSFMEKMRLSEDQFATYAKQNFFKCEEWELNLPHDRLWRGERIDTFVNPADPAERWCAPPLLLTQQAAGDGYRWDVRPDCAYWLSNRGFNEEYAEAIPGCCFVHRGWISNPYFTIEFKKNDWKPGVAATQLLTAAAIALYNRCALSAQRQNSVTEDTALRHYGVTFEGSQFVVYVVRPTRATHDGTESINIHTPEEVLWSEDETRSRTVSWHGCEMSRLAQGDCTIPRNVQRLANWINEIHRWGITEYARSVQNDIKSALAVDGFDVSALDDFIA